MNALTGSSIHGYELKERIGSGGFGAVYRAHQPAVGREVAIKVILPEHARHPDFVARFEAEARTIARLEHPHIVPLYDYWHDELGAFLVMRYLKGGSLRQRLEAEGALRLERAGQFLEAICEALSAAHEAGVVHRDLKPENILLDEREQAYLTDFGVAKDLSARALTQTGTLIGSAAYLAPEQARNETITPRADVYALGVLAFELFTGRHPFPDDDPVQLLQRHLNEPLPSAVALRPDLPPAIDEVIQHATAKIPGRRYASVAEAWEGLRRSLQSPGELAPPRSTRLPSFLEEVGESPPVQPAPFVGREAELARLDELLQATVGGRGRVVFIAGGAGQGKTALASAFARRALQVHTDLVLLNGDCNAQAGIGDPYHPFREILATLTGEIEPRWAAGGLTTEAAGRLWRLLPDSLQALTGLAPDLVDLMVPASQLSARAALAAPEGSPWRSDLEAFLERRGTFTGSSAPKQIDLFEQFTRLLRAVSERVPLLMTLDDFQWADNASVSLLFHLGRRIAERRILILCAYRPDEVALGREGERHPLESVVNELVRVHGVQPLDLAEAGQGEGRAFIQAFLETEPNRLGPEFGEALFQHTGGHPLFTVELLRALQERGDLRKDPEGFWVASPDLAWDQLPARVEAVIEERIGRLQQELRELLSVASVEGQDFTAQVLARIQALEERKLLRELSQELQKRHRLIRELGEIRAGRQVLSRYQFAHHLFQRYLYNGLGAGERRLLHGEIASTLEEMLAEQAPTVAVQLAYHYQKAEHWEKAAHFLRLAGDQAKAAYANQEALRYYSELLPLLPDPSPQRFDALAARSEVLGLIGRKREQRGDAETMLALAQRLGDQTRRCDALLALADYHLETEHVLSRAPAEAALEIAQRLNDPVREGAALRRLGWGQWVKCDYAASRRFLEQAVERFRAAGLNGEAATALHMLSLALGGMAEREAGMQAALEAVELSRGAGDRRQEATGLRRVAIAHINRRDYAEALPIAERALALHRQVGDWGEEARALNVLAIVRNWLREFELAEQLWRRSLEIAEAIGSTTDVTMAIWNLVTAHYWRRGQFQASLAFTEAQLEKAMAAEDEWRVGYLHMVKGIVLQAFGRLEAALAAHETARSMLRELGASEALPMIGLTAWVARLHARLGEFEPAHQAAAQALALAEKYGDPMAVATPLFSRAFLALLEGKPEAMRLGLDQAKEAAALAERVRDDGLLEESLNTAAELHLALGQPEAALEVTQELMRLLDYFPSHPAPHEYLFSHARALQALGRAEEAVDCIRRAHAWVMLVAENTSDDELRRSWLQEAHQVPRILAAAAEAGID